MNMRQKLAVLATGIGGLAIGSLGLTGAFAATAAPTPAPVATAAPTPVTSAASAPEAAGTEAPDAAGTEAPDAAGEPAGGHADPAGQNVDHQFEGQE